jgi:hypothetical protein
MRRLLLLLSFLLLLPVAGLAQQESPAAAPQDQGAAQQPDNGAKQDKKDKKEDKKDKKDKKKGSEDLFDSAVFSEQIANNVLSDLKDGFEGHSQRLALSAFDDEKMEGYLSFEDQLQMLFEKYEAFRVHYRIAQSATEGSKGVILVDWQMEEMPRGGSAPPLRRDGQIKFELERGRKGWKIVDFNPRGAFS